LEEATSWRDRFLLVLLWFCGLRIGEVLGLRRADMHFADSSSSLGCSLAGPHLHVIRRDNNPNGASAKSRHERTVPVVSWVLAYYDRYTTERLACPAADGCDFVFVNLFHAPLGQPMTASAVRQGLRSLSRRAGLARSVHPHMLRHSAGSEMADAGAAIDVVQELLGHRSIISTQRYVHPSADRMRRAVEAVEKVASQRRAQRQKEQNIRPRYFIEVARPCIWTQERCSEGLTALVATSRGLGGRAWSKSELEKAIKDDLGHGCAVSWVILAVTDASSGEGR
jgi:site-specific recombinase XerC